MGGLPGGQGRAGAVPEGRGRCGARVTVPSQPRWYPQDGCLGRSSTLGAAGSSPRLAASAERCPRGDTERSELRLAVSPESMQMRS